jgi:two-component system CitB family sensor kinase
LGRLRRPRLTLASEILSLHLAIILAALVVGVAASLWVAGRHLDDEYGARALSIAQSVAAVPAVSNALLAEAPTNAVQPLAEGVRRSSGATFVVVMNRDGVRLSHPNPALIGKTVTDFGPALDGRPWIGHDNDNLGPAVRAKAPVFDSDGHVVGVVSVGFREDIVQAALTSEFPAVGITLGSALALAAAGSFLLARRVKRKTFGLEPEEIGRVLEQREAILHGIREGTVAADLRGRITLINDEARDLLGLDASCVGRPVDDALPDGRIRDMLHGDAAGIDEVVVNGDRVLLANRMPVAASGGVIGYVVTLRDRTEIERALRELDSVRGMSDALRAQAHEFSNRLHTLAGLIEMGRMDEALRLITDERTAQQQLAETLARQVDHPILSALLLSKSVVAAERGIDFQLTPDTHVSGDLGDPRSLVTIVGNLVDNAFDAVSALPHTAERRVDLSMRMQGTTLAVDVRDSGPGIDPSLGAAIFDEGVTSKTASGRQRGLGLSLVRHAVQRRGGVVDVVSDGGALFRVRLPLELAAAERLDDVATLNPSR